MTRLGLALVISLLTLLPQAPATNYDEAKVPAYQLPPLLVTAGGGRVDARSWPRRRQEIQSLLESQMFGRAPARPGRMAFELLSVDRKALGGQAIRKEVAIGLGGRTLNLLVYLPAKAGRPAPVFVGLGFGPNQTTNADPGIRMAGQWARDKATGTIALQPSDRSPRGSTASRWQVEKLISRGYGLARMYYGDIEPDIPGAMKLGVRASGLPASRDALSGGEWGAIAAWAWGLSRAADYLVTDREVDAGRLAVIGHSRLGKTALWAGALDSRFAIVVSNDSGEGGAAISRRVFGETVADLNTRFPHWFCVNYAKWNGRETEMPFDAHMLLALAAPRPLYVASALDDQWADPKGEFLAAVAASEVYELLGRKGLGTKTMPPVDAPVGDTVRYHVRTGKHDITAYDWDQYLAFADRHFKRIIP
jgi:hypothetical protein